MTVRDVIVQIGFLMVTAGVMLAAWALLTGQFWRGEPEPEIAEDEPEPDVAPPAPLRKPRPRAQTRTGQPARTRQPPRAKKPTPRKRGPSA